MHHRILILALFIFSALSSCRKDDFLDEPLHINGQLNDSAFSLEYPPFPMGNSYGVRSAIHYGNCFAASFTLDPMRYIDVTFGQLTSQEPQVTYEMFKSLFVTGEKKYDSIRLAPYQAMSNRVEVDYRDEHGKRWSTTHLVVDNGTIRHSVQQPGSRFVIEEVREMTVDGKQGIKFKGYFNCILYEENGSRTKQLKVDEFVTFVSK